VPYYHSTESPDETFEDNELAADVELGDDDETQSEYENRLGRTISYSSQTGIEPGPLESPMLRATSRRGQDGNKGVNGIHRSRDSSVATGAGRDEAGREAKSPFHGGISHRQFWLIFLGLMGNMFIVCFDATIMASSHPVITSYFHSSNSASWLSTAFLLTSTAFQPLSGRLSDTMGRKPPLIFGMVLFIAGTLWCALAQSMTSFIFARALCGLGAGATMTMGSIITSDLVPIEIRGIYQSYINIVYGLGSALGVATGGAMADHLGWRWEFGVQSMSRLPSLSGGFANIL
jgi:Na+/melibiose symporter-like transporter